MQRTIGIIATLDTKGDEVEYIKKLIEIKECPTIVIDPGVLGKPTTKADISRERIAKAGGSTLKELIESEFDKKETTRDDTMRVMIKGATSICRELYSEGKLHGIISLGGSSGTTIGTAIMKELPISVPKFMVSTFILPEFFGEEAITVMQTPADILGLNRVMRKTLAQAAAAIVGMVEADVPEVSIRPLIGITSLGVTTLAVMKIKSLLEEKGNEVIVFHNKSNLLDKLVEEGLIEGIIDLTPNELIKIFFMKTALGREDRLEFAGKRGLPQIIVPGGLDMLIFNTSTEQHGIPTEYMNRKTCKHGPYVTLVRTSKEENEELGRIIAEKANRARGPVTIVIPIQGFSARDKEGEALFDHEIDKAFTKSVRNYVKDHVRVIEIDAHINDDKFAKEIVDIFIKIKKGEKNNG